MAHQFSDELIGQIRDLLQVAILTGTDIIDHLRMVYVEVDDNGRLTLTNEYKEVFNSQLESMVQQVEDMQAAQQADVEAALASLTQDSEAGEA